MKSKQVNEINGDLLKQSVLIDVRSPGEFSSLHAVDAINIPLDTCRAELIEDKINVKEVNEVLLICQSGTRARMAYEQLQDCSFVDKLCVVEGGTTAWSEAGKEVVRGKGVISIERQVRIGAGLLVLLGVILGYWIHPGYLGISAFVGAGLTFAGITDFCGMGLILAKMPWNNKTYDNECPV